MLKELVNHSMSEARNELTALPVKREKRHSAAVITRRGKPVLAGSFIE